MAKYSLDYAPEIKEHLKFIDSQQHRFIQQAIFEQLQFEPLTITRNRKPLDPAIQDATWELRCGQQNTFRVLYAVVEFKDSEDESEFAGLVSILAIGEKRGEKLFIAGQEVKS